MYSMLRSPRSWTNFESFRGAPMRILQLMPYPAVPATSGGSLRMLHLLEALAQEHQVTVLAYGQQGHEVALQQRVTRGLERVRYVEEPWVLRRRRLGQLYSMVSRKSFWNLS